MSERKLKIAALLKELYDMAEVPAPSSRIPFYFNDVRAGHIERTDAEFLASTFRFCDVRPDAFVFTAEDSGQASRRLAAISHLYKGTDKVFAWRDELLSVTASDDIACESPLTVIERAMCRPFAFNTFAVHLNPFTRDGRMWVAQRSFKKAIGPGYWDNCAAGLVGAGEPFGLAMEREAFEEAGIPETCDYFRLDACCSIPAACFKDAEKMWGRECFVVPEYAFAVKVENASLLLSHEHTVYEWLTYESAYARLQYDSNKTALWELNRRIALGALKQKPSDSRISIRN